MQIHEINTYYEKHISLGGWVNYWEYLLEHKSSLCFTNNLIIQSSKSHEGAGPKQNNLKFVFLKFKTESFKQHNLYSAIQYKLYCIMHLKPKNTWHHVYKCLRWFKLDPIVLMGPIKLNFLQERCSTINFYCEYWIVVWSPEFMRAGGHFERTAIYAGAVRRLSHRDTDITAGYTRDYISLYSYWFLLMITVSLTI